MHATAFGIKVIPRSRVRCLDGYPWILLQNRCVLIAPISIKLDKQDQIFRKEVKK